MWHANKCRVLLWQRSAVHEDENNNIIKFGVINYSRAAI